MTLPLYLWIVLYAMTAGIHAEGKPLGALVMVGGGSTPEAAVKKVIALAGGKNAPIVVLAHVRENPSDGAESAAMFREQGANNVSAPETLDPAELKRLLGTAQGVWIPGGDQNRFADRFPESSGVPEAIRAVYRRGGVVGGTSAGASLLGELMPTGEETAVKGVRAGASPVRAGLALLSRTIIDQHFLTRSRFNRLLTAVLERPNYHALGIEEGSWGVYQNHCLSVEAGQIVVLLPRAMPRRSENDLGSLNITLKILLPHDKTPL